ncbi:MAG: AtpZ/AtpI family protein [Phycisphaeraceae bacterium]
MPSDPPKPSDRGGPADQPQRRKPENTSKTTDSQGKFRPKFSVTGWLSLGQLASTGMELGLTVAVLALLGWWLDSQWNSSPWMLLTGVLIGTLGSLYKMWRLNAKWFAKKK